MAIQHLFAYSSTCDGAGIAAGSVYGCGSLPDIKACAYGIEDYGTESDFDNLVAYIDTKLS